MTECAVASPKEEIAKRVTEYTYPCIHGDNKCVPQCPMLENCWSLPEREG